jgi:hypothetical protein
MDETPPTPTPLSASQRYYQAHKTQRREYGREYYRKNRERILGSITRKRTKEPVSKGPVLTITEIPTVPLNESSPLAEHKRRGVTLELNPVLLFN